MKSAEGNSFNPDEANLENKIEDLVDKPKKIFKVIKKGLVEEIKPVKFHGLDKEMSEQILEKQSVQEWGRDLNALVKLKEIERNEKSSNAAGKFESMFKNPNEKTDQK